MQIVLAILVLMVLVIVHEWGHLITALKVGIPVEEFSVGMGPLLLSKKFHNVQYSWRLIPLGGYVRLKGEVDYDDDPRGFINRKPWEKIVVAAGGPVMNFVAAILIFILIFSVIGMPKALDEPVFGGILEDSPAAEAGLQEGDRCLEVNGTPVFTWGDFSGNVSLAEEGDEILLLVDRNGEQQILTLRPYYDKEQNRMLIGVYNSVVYERVSILKAIPAGFQQTWLMTCAIVEGLVLMVTGQVGVNELSGPVGITTMIGDAMQSGLVTLLAFMGFLSVNLGLLNLLPIPALDGSKIVFAVVEWIRKKRLNPDHEALINLVGFLFMIGLVIFATCNDIGRLIH